MRQIWKIARREFRGYFDHATAYVLVVAFLALSLFLTFRGVYGSGLASLRPLFDHLPWLMAVFVPAITMRSLAEERRRGTLEWILAQPVDEAELVAGKFLGDWLFVLVALAGTLPTALGLLALTPADPGIVVAQYAGAAFLSAEMVALGLLASSLTKNQITAFIVAATASVALVLAGLRFTLMGFGPGLSELLGRLSVLRHFENVARGVLDLRDVLYFVTATGAFLAGAYFVVVRDRLSAGRGAYRRLRTGVTALIVGVVVLNLLGRRIGGRLDLTRENLYTLSEGTRETLSGLEDVARVKLFVSEGLPPEVQVTLRDLRDMLSDYRRASDGSLRVTEANPDESEEARREAESLGIQPLQFNVMRDDGLQVQRGWLGLAVLHAGESRTLQVARSTEDLEYRLTSALAALRRERAPRVAFLTGFGARPPSRLRAFREALSRRYEVGTTALDDSVPARLPPDSVDVAVLAGPSRPLSGAALETLDAYLTGGGAALVLAEGAQIRSGRMPMTRPVDAGLGPLLEERGVRLGSGVVYDLSSHERISGRGLFSAVQPYPLWPVVQPAEDAVVTRGLQGVSLAWATPLEVTDSSRVRPVLETTPRAGLQPPGRPVTPDTPLPDDPERLGVRTMAVQVDPGPPAAAGGDGGSSDTPGPASGGTPAGTGESGGPRGGGETSGGPEGGAEGGPSAAGGEGGVPTTDPPASGGAGRMIVVGDATFLERQFARGNPQNLVFAANAVDWLAQDESLIAIRSKDRTPPRLTLEAGFPRQALKWGNLIGVPLIFVIVGGVRVLRRRKLARSSGREEATA